MKEDLYNRNRDDRGSDRPDREPRDSDVSDYNRPEHYRIKRREFGHGETGHMNPGDMETYGDRTFRGYSTSPREGRNYEDNAGYRSNYNSLGEANRSEGHRGKGPKSYQRRDDRILEDINDRLCDNPYIDASEIEVSVEKGDVILTGTVEDKDSKRLAAIIGESVGGVNNVENRLRVKVRGN